MRIIKNVVAVIKGVYDSGSVIIQKRETVVKEVIR